MSPQKRRAFKKTVPENQNKEEQRHGIALPIEGIFSSAP
jgi:hypothetical protein